MQSATTFGEKRRTALSLVLVVAVAALVQIMAWKVGRRIIDPSGWLLYGASALAIVFFPDHVSRSSGSRALRVGLQCLFLVTFLTLYDQNAALVAMVPPARFGHPSPDREPAGDVPPGGSGRAEGSDDIPPDARPAPDSTARSAGSRSVG